MALKSFQSDFIEMKALRLHDGFSIPVEAEPAEIIASRRRGARFDAGRIHVFDAQDNAAALTSGGQPRQQIGPGVAHALRSRRRWAS